MKIAITADLHLRTKDEHPERYNAIRNIFKQTASEGIENLIIAGDLFDKDFNSYSEFEKVCAEFKRNQVHIIPGNHDSNINENIIVGENIKIYNIPTLVPFDEVLFLFVPYQEKVAIGEKIAEFEMNLKKKDWVLVAHGDFYEGIKEQDPNEPGIYMPISRGDIEKFNPLNIFLGHSHQGLSQGKINIPGSPCGLSIRDTGKRIFLAYDTTSKGIEEKIVQTDVLFFDESFIIVPVEESVTRLKQDINKRIKSWNVDSSDYSKVRVRVKASGYSNDKKAILQTLEEEFKQFKFHNDEGPIIDELLLSSDERLESIAKRAMSRIDELDWAFEGNEPTKDEVKLAVLAVIYKR